MVRHAILSRLARSAPVISDAKRCVGSFYGEVQEAFLQGGVFFEMIINMLGPLRRKKIENVSKTLPAFGQ